MQTLGCYLFPLKMGKLLSKLTDGYRNIPEEDAAVTEDPGAER